MANNSVTITSVAATDGIEFVAATPNKTEHPNPDALGVEGNGERAEIVRIALGFFDLAPSATELRFELGSLGGRDYTVIQAQRDDSTRVALVHPAGHKIVKSTARLLRKLRRRAAQTSNNAS